ncbi:opacity-associated protein OapA [Aggregatibacter sp. oral taxon 513]|uniref:opacity-associated protein OapA n=1 Tax=Aggregatibacter TaxID=416916 RepID=UPI001BA489D5|nr:MULTISPECIES: opacity-associated protein OapA [Aggregatibacter]QUC05516.1 opacity-associated protein OapA [Aggregatibacter sp. oral taxon 513]
MDSEKITPENENNPAQNELDLGFNKMEPITPKKPTKPEPSFFEKAKGMFAKKEQKNTENQFATRKEPVFGDSAPADVAAASSNVAEETIIAEESIETTNVVVEPVLNAATNETKPQAESVEKPVVSLKNPETWPMLAMLPQKHRRLFVTILALVLLLMFILWMKPSSDTVQSYEQQSNNDVPIQFQQLDQSQVNEPTVLDNPTSTGTQPNTAENIVPAQSNEPMANTPVAEPQAMNSVSENKPAEQPKAVEPAKPQEMVKPQSTPHETVKKPEPVKTKTVEKPQKVEHKNPPVKAQSAKTEKQVVEILEAKPATTKTVNTSAESKTLVVPQGVSLMQVFRNNNLPIADVNAMTKANGAGNALSSFKPGDKVQVTVNAQGRVNELRLSNGARFVRQADGSYQFKK